MNPIGPTVLQNDNGCDSTVIVTLLFEDEVNSEINETFCAGSGDFVEVNGEIFNEMSPTGTVTIPNGSQLGCDSTITVTLFYEIPTPGTYENTLCSGDSEVIGGTVFDEMNPSGDVFLLSANGCDSLVTVTLMFTDAVNSEINETFCSGSGDFVEVNGEIFNEGTPTGMVTLPNGSAAGCDSIINVSLLFEIIADGTYENTLCTGGSETIGGILFDENNPTGTATLQSINGCDSLVNVTILFENEVEATISETLCPGESITIDGVIYDENNPMGSTTLPNGSYLGCDSITNVQVDFYPEATADFSTTLDIDESITIGGITFDSGNSNGVVVLPNASVNGCDSTINVTLQFTQEFEIEIFSLAPNCPGEGTGNITIDTITGLDFPILIVLNGIPRGTFVEYPIVIEDVPAGFYMVDVFNTIGEGFTTEIDVPNALPLTLDIGEDQTVRIGEEVNLNPQTTVGNAIWEWTPNDFLVCDTCLNTLSIPLNNITYQLMGTTDLGCVIMDEITLLVERGNAIFASNIFSPNNDGINDNFYIQGTKEIANIKSFQVFDRWGGLMFVRNDIPPNDPQNGWDGTFEGEPVELGVYVFFAEVELVDGTVEVLEGGVTVVR